MTVSLPAPDQLSLPWKADDLLDVISKLPQYDLVSFLSPHFKKDLGDWSTADLVELALQLLQTWEAAAVKKEDFLLRSSAALCRASFEAFVRRMWDTVPGASSLIWNWHMSVFCECLQKVAVEIFAGHVRPHDLICNVSPGTSKSSIWSVLFPAWVWTRMPNAKIISASNTDSLATDLASFSREVIGSIPYQMMFPEIQFTGVQDAKGHYRNTLGGMRFCCTVAGKPAIGKHAHFRIVDDPIDPKKVLSEAERQVAADFVTTSISSRVMKTAEGINSVLMLVMQRLGVGDPTDVLLNVAKREGAYPVYHVCLPAQLTEDVSPPELRKYYEGYNYDANRAAEGLMDPIRLSQRELKSHRANMGEWAYAGQYLQKPRPPGGGMFKEHYFTKVVPAAPFHARRVRMWDLAASDGHGCWTAGVLMARDSEGGLYVEDCVHGQWEPVERNQRMLATAQRDRNKYGAFEPTIWVEREGGASAKDAFLHLVRTLQGFTVRQFTVSGLGSKDRRAEPWSAQLAGGNVWIVNDQSKSWDVNGFIREHIDFRPDPTRVKRKGGVCDQVDAAGEAFAILTNASMRGIPLRTYQLNQSKDNQGRWLISCGIEDLPRLDIDTKQAVVVIIKDPVPPLQTVLDNATGKELTKPLHLPPHMATLELSFADLNPKDYQDKWTVPIDPWRLPPERLQFSRELAKKLWALLLRKFDKPWQVLVVADQSGEDREDGRAASVALGVADMLRIPRTAVYVPEVDGERETLNEVPNDWIYDQIKLARHLIVA